VGYEGSVARGKKVFSIRLPIDIEEKLEGIAKQERITLIREAITTAVRNYEQA